MREQKEKEEIIICANFDTKRTETATTNENNNI